MCHKWHNTFHQLQQQKWENEKFSHKSFYQNVSGLWFDFRSASQIKWVVWWILAVKLLANILQNCYVFSSKHNPQFCAILSNAVVNVWLISFLTFYVSIFVGKIKKKFRLFLSEAEFLSWENINFYCFLKNHSIVDF